MMKLFPFLFACWLLIALTICSGETANAQGFDGKLAAHAVDAMKGQPLVLTLRTGVKIDEATFIGTVADSRSGGVRFIEYRQGRRSTKTKAEDIYKLSMQERAYSFRYHGPTSSYHLIDEVVVACFQHREHFVAFEDVVMENPNFGDSGTHSLNGILQTTDISKNRGPVTKFLVQYLIHRDPSAVSQYILDLKAGQTPEWALQTNFGLTHETLAAETGRALGIPNVRP